ncbi:hypothetical protein TPHA_0G00440 [Tetrapisispora phaffii CBS 4417]|uniref:Zinc/iron permease n=1 Tax=Tetrapisispora phaffii (strain ATCC 24235 / CBS 4417 / NBRC 1672 / NRRL Y-8282 / UCD 70-5) TaxID=1071381 RepID=G8BVF2_TETPH|nr:hypothetical protein TPHA_0G00440 [Tetrapisispora phaffii CBS 4417]CCE63880.1 hypothetical protein TPHA_0G00440 [Tetrapisispora phaffii CBS 4417]
MAISLTTVFLLAISLLVATFAIGVIPLYYVNKNLEQGANGQKIAILSQFGVGMLIGTSFMLVIPEGVKSCVEYGGNVGLNLLIGFLVVYLLDRGVSVLMANSSKFSFFDDDRSADIHSVRDLLKNPKIAITSILKNNVVFALFIHGISDGIALGTTSNNEELLIVVLIAIVVHKIPAVLSLTSLMISKQRLPEWQVLSNLFAFALSTPLGYVVVSIFNLKASDSMEWIGGSLLLMSGGSLLYASFTAFTEKDYDHTGGYEPALNPSVIGSDMSLELDLDATDPTGIPNKNNTSPVSLRDSNDIELNAREENTEHSKLPYDESVFTVAGVIIPIIVSFLIQE